VRLHGEPEGCGCHGGRAGAERALESRSAERTDRELRAEQCTGSRARCSAGSWGWRELDSGEGRRAGVGTRGAVEKKLRARQRKRSRELRLGGRSAEGATREKIGVS
jgi:hypothetical protein